MIRLRLLLLAPGCDRNDVGESWVGHQWVRRLGERHDVTLLTYFKHGFEPPSQQLEHVRVIEWPDIPLVGRAERFNSLFKPGYMVFYLRCRRWIRDAIHKGEYFDLAHQVAPVAMRYPCPFAGSGIPYVIGPVGGALPDPEGFESESDNEPWYVSLRGLDRWRLRFDPLMRRTFDDATCVIGIGPYVAETLAARRVRRFETMSETGIAQLPPPVDRRDREEPVRLLHVGRLVRTKGVRDAIRAVAKLRATRAVALDVVGDGVDRGPCERLAEELGVTDQVTFHGRVPRERVDEFYRAADIFLFPSYREPGGNAVYEAMSFGLPLVVADCGGPAEAVDQTCGFKVRPRDPDQFATAIADALEGLVDDVDLRIRMGEAARARVGQIALWDQKVLQLEALYADILESNATRQTSRNST